MQENVSIILLQVHLGILLERQAPVAPKNGKNVEGSLFVGIEDAARASRQKELRSIRLSQLGDEIGDKQPDIQIVKKKLRWHALVDSGMGRLGFKTDIVNDEKRDGTWKATDAPPPVKGIDVSDSSSECCGVRDTVSIIKDLYDAEVHLSVECVLTWQKQAPHLLTPMNKWNDLEN